jgi:hypothetical protein
MTGSKGVYKSDAEVEALVRRFEDCTLPDTEFGHAAHLVVALFYLHSSRLTVPQAAERMRGALHRFLDHYGEDRGKYNETITIFWVKLVLSFLNRTLVARTSAEMANEMTAAFGSSRLIYDYYSKELLMSDRARVAWAEPDLKPLDF